MNGDSWGRGAVWASDPPTPFRTRPCLTKWQRLPKASGRGVLHGSKHPTGGSHGASCVGCSARRGFYNNWTSHPTPNPSFPVASSQANIGAPRPPPPPPNQSDHRGEKRNFASGKSDQAISGTHTFRSQTPASSHPMEMISHSTGRPYPQTVHPGPRRLGCIRRCVWGEGLHTHVSFLAACVRPSGGLRHQRKRCCGVRTAGAPNEPTAQWKMVGPYGTLQKHLLNRIPPP